MAITSSDLAKYDFVVLCDKSGSMGTKDCAKGSMTRWRFAQEQTEQFARVCEEFDDDGIDVGLFSNRVKMFEGVTSDKVKQIFTENEPGGTTDTAEAIQKAFDIYVGRGRVKPMIVVCVTDGEPDSQSELKKTIIDISKKLKDDNDFGILFVQVGYDSAASRFLNEIDNNLVGAKFDIVSAVTADDASDKSIKELLVAAIND